MHYRCTELFLFHLQAIRRLSTFEVSGALISKPTSPDLVKHKHSGDTNNRESGADITRLTGFENNVFPETLQNLDTQDQVEKKRPVHSTTLLEINSGQIAALFRKKPELAEFIFLELIAAPLKT